MDRTEFFNTIFEGIPADGLVEVAFGTPPTSPQWVTLQDLHKVSWPSGRDAYYGPAARMGRNGKKENILGSRVLWADIDDSTTTVPTVLPSIVVESGHGLHIYWLLEEWITDVEEIERLNKAVAADTEADHAWNANRLLRVPGTRNFRRGEAVECNIRRSNINRVYRPEFFTPLAGLDAKARHKIRTGDRRGYRSRSERDWAVVRSLLSAGADDTLIKYIFGTQPIGDKFRDETGGDKYLDRTISKAKESAAKQGKRTFDERADGYYVVSGKRTRRVSTFVIVPKLLLENADTEPDSPLPGDDAIVGDVLAAGYRWDDITFTRSAFTSVEKMDRECPLMAWQWLGSNVDVRSLLPHLLEQLQAEGLPRTLATRVLGLHKSGERHLFVGDRSTLGEGEIWLGSNGPLVYLDSGREHGVLAFNQDPPSARLLTALKTLLPRTNEPEVFWPMLGWYAASMFKPAFEDRGHRFPVLNVHGTRGSGKTTSILRIMMPLFGQKEPKSYDANTTRFVILSLLGSSNAVPVAFSEFRFGAADKFLRYILLSYDTGHDPRGRADQTTVDYPLSAPFSVDGEDLVADPAAKERIVPVTLHPRIVMEEEDAHKAFNTLRVFDLTPFGRYYIQAGLKGLMEGTFDQDFRSARKDIFDAFPGRLPDRVRGNFTVVWTGVTRFCRLVGMDRPPCTVLGRSIRTVYDLERGRAPTLADEMVEDLINAIATPGRKSYFTWHYDHTTRTVWFQLASVHNWWVYQRRRQGRGVLERDALRGQLLESEFIEPPKLVAERNVWMYGINLQAAHDAGLDVPSDLSISQIQF